MVHFSTIIISLLSATTFTLAQNFDWNCELSLAPCNNACYAANCRNSGPPLTFDADASHRPGRRRDSGCARTPCSNNALPYSSFGNSCDEFPFASTQEGGTGAILRCVDGSENSSEGGQLRAFYANLNDGDEFGIVMRNFGGAAYCENAQRCANDGGEFELANGNFQNAKRSRIMPRGADFVASRAEQQPRSPFRKFRGDDGVERIWLGKGNNTVVGTKVWDGDEGHKEVTLVEELYD